jgi:DNA gyrase/topoisomerase IV subunit B
MQGKPMNALKASKKTVNRNELYAVLRDAIGAGWDDEFDPASMRYSRVILLFDPDADGIHCGALMLMYFWRWMRPMLDSGRLSVVQPPLYQITSTVDGDVIHVYSSDRYQQICQILESKKIEFQAQRYRGLASMGGQTLSKTCLDLSTRQIHQLTVEDAEAAIETFGGRRRT